MREKVKNFLPFSSQCFAPPPPLWVPPLSSSLPLFPPHHHSPLHLPPLSPAALLPLCLFSQHMALLALYSDLFQTLFHDLRLPSLLADQLLAAPLDDWEAGYHSQWLHVQFQLLTPVELKRVNIR